MLLEFKLNRAIDLKKVLTPLTSLAQTASIINSTDAVTLLATILNGDAIAVLRISSTEFVHFFCHEGYVAVFDIVMLYRYLHFFSNDNLPVTVGIVRVEDDGGKLTATMPNIGQYNVALFLKSHVTFNITGVYNSVLRDLYECDIVGDTGNDPILLHFRVDHLVSIGKAISLSQMVWIYGSYSALPMMHFRVPPIGELSYYFV
ncbi:hypothetical protein EZV62_009825 [Acer yangbiense]|uniref:Uncharacterized protein n=1 Tax=Acer yangbiense TaxID=1000413 RepID=A0A5C7I0H5_9ROSI|nr:hypothetical protein EZV62_009825 [Acer yangbiense]